MTADRAAEVAGVAVTAFATATAGAIAVDASTVLSVLAGIGAAAVAGYYAARITTEREIATMSATMSATMRAMRNEIAGLRDEVRMYYQRKESGR